MLQSVQEVLELPHKTLSILDEILDLLHEMLEFIHKMIELPQREARTTPEDLGTSRQGV